MSSTNGENAVRNIADSFRTQAERCRAMDSPLYGALLEHCAADVEAGGPVGDALVGWDGDPESGFLPLRLLAAVHALVLDGAAPGLARHYPTAGGEVGDAEQAWLEFRSVVARSAPRIQRFVRSPPQTNDVRRAAPLLLGFLEVAGAFARPIWLSEIGASAGLNLLWDRYHYELGGVDWADPASPVQIATDYDGPTKLLERRVAVVQRQGCDLRPLRVASADDVRLLESYIWATEVERLRTLRAAVDIARTATLDVARAPAEEWVALRVAQAPPDTAHVVFHSAVWSYLSSGAQTAFTATMRSAGAAATRDRPLAWLHLEDSASGRLLELRLRTWPGGGDRLLATVHPRTRSIRWQGS